MFAYTICVAKCGATDKETLIEVYKLLKYELPHKKSIILPQEEE
jgi:hypothetical protein